ncbi:hypothetical protein Halha_2403 [Halobacteroides halobius DSM 5150]|uniref:Uncharacterized protein n=1 Tax=Halobacteroides halobius (strain ATCC 35273 / DSM 5150 / MD-1) TaxID=748449 RepID=L0KAF9_HALHC|nr:hypothetical protein [Halobacteroides halobius]AGB42277.1 hypothetical protein Halha_2403 [Halobacteroides halobius DSM 5150]
MKGIGKQLSRIIIIVTILVISCTVQAKNNSYYNLWFNIGEHISNINHNLHLEYGQEIKGYQINTQLDLSKEYRFLMGVPKEGDWNYSNYLIKINRKETKLELGNTSQPMISRFLVGGSLVGVYFKQDNFQLWQGIISSSQFGSTKLVSKGISYQENGKKISYSADQLLNQTNHYLAYQDSYTNSNLNLDLDAVLGADTKQLGEALALNLSFWEDKIHYYSNLSYRSPAFTAIQSKFNTGHGKYRISLSGYRKLGAVLINSDLIYSENNLDRQAAHTTKDLAHSWNFNYYTTAGNKCSIYLGYQQQSKYQTRQQKLINLTKDFTLNLGYETRLWDYNLKLARLDAKNSGSISAKYDTGTYQFNLFYKLEASTKKWDDYYDLTLNYEERLNQIDYSLEVNLNNNSSLQAILKQDINYSLTTNQQLSLSLELNKYLEFNHAVRKSLTGNYTYQF